jgi:hypothetical protein
MRLFYLFLIFIFISCTSNNDEIISNIEQEESSIWIVDKNDIKGGGKTYDLSVNPKFGNVSDFEKLSDHEKVALISFNNEVRVYPYFFTNHFEVINDVFNNNNIAVSYCPLTKSGICYNREIDGNIYQILASGFLYKDNMVPADKDLKFYWSQMLMTYIGKENTGKSISNYNLIETNWKTVKEYFYDAKVYYHVKRTAGETDPQLSRTQDSQYIYGVIEEKNNTRVELFSYNLFKNKTKLISKIINNKEVIIIGSEEKYFVTSYYKKDNLEFYLLDDSNFPNILSDNEGNIWNIFGYAISGNRKGEQLESPKAYVAQFWAWKDFYSNLKFN